MCVLIDNDSVGKRPLSALIPRQAREPRTGGERCVKSLRLRKSPAGEDWG